MSELFLVAHKVRGEPAFDIAHRIECVACKQEDGDIPGCVECDNFGFWWIIPTSGHRVYPWWHKQLSRISCEGWLAVYDDPWRDIPPMPPNWPDHYVTKAAPTRPAFLQALIDAKHPAQASGTINRRSFK